MGGAQTNSGKQTFEQAHNLTENRFKYFCMSLKQMGPAFVRPLLKGLPNPLLSELPVQTTAFATFNRNSLNLENQFYIKTYCQHTEVKSVRHDSNEVM